MSETGTSAMCRRAWLRGAQREIAHGRERRESLEEAIGPFQFLTPKQQHLLREHWSPRERQMLLALCDETPFAELVHDVLDLAPCLMAVGMLAFRKLVELGPEGCEPRLTTRGLIAGDRMKDAIAFEAAAL